MAPATSTKRHLLDPLHGYDGDTAADDRRINWRRVQLSATLMVVDIVAEATLNLTRRIVPIWPVLFVALLGTIFFAMRARRAKASISRSDDWLIEAFVLFALCCANALGYLGATYTAGDRIPVGYPMAFLAAAAFFSIPPRRFTMIGAITYAIFATWIVSLPMPFLIKAHPLLNGGLAIIAGCFGRASIARIQQIGYHHRAQVIARNAALHEANVTLERHNEALNELMAVAAHDLRSPLYGLRSVLDLARDAPPETPEGLRRLLTAASQSVGAMVALVTRLLDVHEVEGRQRPAVRCEDIAVLLVTALRRIEPLAQSVGVTLRLEPPVEPALVRGHAGSIDQILDNLLSNAIHYSHPCTTVCASIVRVGEEIIVEIADEGVGIAAADRAMLFTKFRRGSLAPPNGPKGSGLGLYIVDVLARQMDAKCGFRPNPTGGAIFHVAFKPFDYMRTTERISRVDRRGKGTPVAG